MAMNRYGRIYHSDYHYINLRFPSVDARRKFATEFRDYHEGHDHDGDAPRYEDTAASTIGNMQANRVHDAHHVTIDGYATYEIEAYHNPDDTFGSYERSRYRVPTCCVPPTISINRTFIDSSTLTRHELSEIFMDMPDEDFQNLLKSVEKDGFKDPVIRMINEQVLDGWHRYRAAKELNLLRKLRFRQWNEEKEGNPEAFVLARNIERRHLTPGQRAQIVVSFNDRYGHGGDRIQSKSPNGDLKTREDLAKEAGVGKRTIDRAVQVQKAGEEQAKKVIAGEKTQSEVITEETVKSLYEQINPAISEWKKAREGVGDASKSMFIRATLRWEGLPADTETDVKVLKQLLYLLTTTETNILQHLIRKCLDGKDLWADEEEEVAEPTESESELPLQKVIDKVKAEAETEQPTEPAEDSEALKELKRKKKVAQALWDKRIQVGRDWLGKGDSDLNQHLTLMDLEKGFLDSSPTYEHEFKIALKLTSKPDFPLMWEKAAQYTLEELEKFQRVMTVYACDILQWERPDWSPDTNWILPLIDAKKEKATAEADDDEKRQQELKDRLESDLKLHWLEHYSWEGIDTTAFIEAYGVDAKTLVAMQKEIAAEHPEPEDMQPLWDAFNKRVPKWKAKYAVSGYKENDLIQNATETELFDAYRSYKHSEQTGDMTAEELQDLTGLMKRQSYPYARHLRNLLRGDKPAEALPDVERCYIENQLRVLRNTLSSLLDRLGIDDIFHPHKERLTSDIYDVFLKYEEVPTEREMIIALLDVVDGILSEDILETLDNEVLCPDDEADRQAMNSDLVASAE